MHEAQLKNGGKLKPDLIRIDGRSSVARAIKRTSEQLRKELAIGRRLTRAELASVDRTATAIVAADQAQRRALVGEVAFVDAVRATSNARRMRRDLLKSIQAFEDEPGLDTPIDWQAAQ